MKKVLSFILTIFFTISIFSSSVVKADVLNESAQSQLVSIAVQSQVSPTSLIVDADMSTDTDDLIAVRIAEQYDQQGLVDFKALMISVENEQQQGGTAAEGLLDAYGFNDVMIGTTSSGIIETQLPYWGWLSSQKTTAHSKDTAVRQYRRILSQSNDKVAIVITGYFDNLYKLIWSQPDDISDETGLQLIQDHVKFFLVCGAGKGKSPNNYTGFENNTCAYPSAYIAAGDFYKYIGQVKVPIYQYVEDGTMASTIFVGGQDQLEPNDVVYRAFLGADKENGGPGWDAICTWLLLPLLSDNLLSYGIVPEYYHIESTDNPGTRFLSVPCDESESNIIMLNMNWSPKTYKLYIDDAY